MFTKVLAGVADKSIIFPSPGTITSLPSTEVYPQLYEVVVPPGFNPTHQLSAPYLISFAFSLIESDSSSSLLPSNGRATNDLLQ